MSNSKFESRIEQISKEFTELMYEMVKEKVEKLNVLDISSHLDNTGDRFDILVDRKKILLAARQIPTLEEVTTEYLTAEIKSIEQEMERICDLEKKEGNYCAT